MAKRIRKVDGLKAAAKNLIKAYYQLEKIIKEYEEKEKLVVLSANELVDYKTKKYYYECIKETFVRTVDERYRDRVWNHFIMDEAVSEYEKKIIKEEEDRWIASFRTEIGL